MLYDYIIGCVLISRKNVVLQEFFIGLLKKRADWKFYVIIWQTWNENCICNVVNYRNYIKMFINLLHEMRGKIRYVKGYFM